MGSCRERYPLRAAGYVLIREGSPLSLLARLAPHLPYVRRYARALTGDQSTGDHYVRVALEALAKADALAKKLPRGYGPLSDQLRRASQSAFLQLSEGAARSGACPGLDGCGPLTVRRGSGRGAARGGSCREWH